ncbi:MAG: cytochrome c3 family protein [Desulfovibrionaceae bacterium]|nr:cytochrome c3 family protein [Desulfovibrionaceae bacterium]MBF0514768.1 cytochrome c3 family protein [Desulfovibrionaceae bacterium]
MKRKRLLRSVYCAGISIFFMAWCFPAFFDAPQAASKSQAPAEGSKTIATAAYGSPTGAPPFDPASSAFVLSAWSDTGLRLFSDCDAKFSLGGPLVTLRAQLVRRGPKPEIVAGGVTLEYVLEDMQAPAAASPSGLASRGQMKADGGVFAAGGIPVAPYNANGEYQPYPLVRVEARDPATGAVLAVTKAVVANSAKYGCAACHGGDASVPGISPETAARILAAHDKLSATKLAAGKAEACVSCHPETGGSGPVPLSAAIHGFHAQKVKNLGEQACAACHPAKAPTVFSRDHHADRGLACTHCHGSMAVHAASLLLGPGSSGAKSAPKLLALLGDPAKTVAPRTPWANEPECSGCHDFKTRPVVSASAAGKWSEGASALYHLRKDDAGGLACAACHGAAHATYPCENPLGRDRDNVAPIQYQGFAGPLGANGSCAACHTQAMDPAASAHHPMLAPKGTAVRFPAGVELTRAKVIFPHTAHAALDCLKCHHAGYVDGGSLSCSQAGCHDQADPAGGNPLAFRNAFHGEGASCFGCHQARRKAGQPFGPLQCGGCHVMS